MLFYKQTVHVKERDNITDNELLLAISDMLSPIKTDIQDIKNDLQEVKDDVQKVKDDVQKVKNDLQEVKDRVTRIELTQENIILPRLNTIESCYTSTYGRYKDQVETYESMKQDLSLVKRAVTEHSELLQKIS